MNKKNSTLKTIVTMLFVAGMIIAVYFYIANSNSGKEPEDDYIQTEIEKLLEMDFDTKYPVTAREVLKCYSRIMLQLYGGKVDDTEIEALVRQLRKLYAVELLEKNPIEVHLSKIKAEIAQYKKNQQMISDYQLEKNTSALQWTDSNVRYYRLIGAFAIKKKGITSRTYQQFILCEQEGDWKVLGWQQVDGAEMDTE